MSPPPFQAFLDSQRADVYRVCVAAVGRDEADDVFQETFVAALRAYPRLRGPANLRSWVLTIASRKAIDSHRARRRRPVPSDALPDVGTADAERNGYPELWARVRDLPAKQRAALLYRFAGDLAYADVGRAMKTSEEAARRNVHEGLTKLREQVT